MLKITAVRTSFSLNEAELAKKGRAGPVIQLTLLTLLFFNLSPAVLNLTRFRVMISVIVCINICRLFLAVTAGAWPNTRVWSLSYRVLTLVCALSWATLQCLLYRSCGATDPAVLLGLMIMAGVSSACSLSLAAAPWLNRGFIVCTLLPPAIYMMSGEHRLDTTLGLASLIYACFLLAHVAFQTRMNNLAAERQSQYDALSKTAFEGVCISADGKILDASESLLRIFNTTSTHLIGSSTDQLVSTQDIHHVNQIIQSQTEEPFEANFVRADGSVFMGEAVSRACIYKGRPAQVTCVRDISHRKSIEDALRASELQVRQKMLIAFDSVPGIVWVLKANGAAEFFNRQGIDYLGISPERFGDGWGSAIHPEDVPAATKDWETAMATRDVCHTSFRLLRAEDKAYRWHLAISSPIKNAAGEVESWVGTCMDIEESKQVSFERAEALFREKAAVDSAKLKAEFLANMSHEIRTPLNGILGASEILAEEAQTEIQKKYTRVLEESGRGLMSIVNDILDFSKIEAGKFALELNDFSLSSVVEGQVELLEKLAADKGLALRTFVDPAIPGLLRGDAGRIAQILLNLIGNAIKFTTAGSVSVTATAEKVNQKTVSVRIGVKDTGVGIDPEAQERLFQPFSQADNSVARKFGGTGLGLSICRQLVQLMGGRIGVDSVGGQGSEFWLVVDFEISQSEVISLADRHGTLDGVRALLVGHDAEEEAILRAYLSSWGVAVESQAATATPAGGSGLYDIFISDGLPENFYEDETGEKNERVATRDKKPALLARVNSQQMAELRPRTPYLTGVSVISKSARQSELYNAVLDLTSTRHPHRENRVVSTHAPATVARNAGRNLRILVAEDNSTNQMLAVANLKKLGYLSHVVANGKEAVEAFSQEKFDLILMDFHMPEMDGLTASSQIRALEARTGRHIPIVALTASARKEDELLCLAACMDDYITKPLRRQTLQTILEKWLPASPTEVSETDSKSNEAA